MKFDLDGNTLSESILDNSSKLIENAPLKYENFIEVAGVFDE